ncbi:MAG: transposase [Sedimenticola sp.]
MTSVVGIDVSKKSIDVAWEAGGKLHHCQFAYSDEGIASLLEQTPEQSFYVMEATGIYHSRLALKLHESGRSVSVVNPLVIKRFAQMQLSRLKSDKADADLIREQTRLLNRKEAHAHHTKPSRFVKNQISSQLKQLKEKIWACERHLEELVKKSFAELYERLLTIPSIGPKSAMELIIVTEDFNRFTYVKALSVYIGVSPTTYQSGTSVQGKGGIAKFGQGRMRQLLYLCSWTAKFCNPACRLLYTRLKALGKPQKVINIAIAHKLLRQAFAVATKKCVFFSRICLISSTVHWELTA